MRAITTVLLACSLAACIGSSAGSDHDSGQHNIPDGALDGDVVANPDAANPVDAAIVDARPVPPDGFFTLPDASGDAFVHPGPNFGPAMVLDFIAIQSSPSSLGLFAGLVNPEIDTAVQSGDLLMMIEFLDLDDTTGVIDDADVTLVIYRAIDADFPATPWDNFGGAGRFLVDIDNAVVVPDVSIVSGQLDVPAGTFEVLGLDVVGFGEMFVINPSLNTTIGDDMSALSAGTVAGAVLARSLDLIPNQTILGDPNGSILDMLVTSIFQLQPDVDIDEDGHIESYEDTSPTSPGADNIISMCHDLYGDLDDPDCPQHGWMWDGFSITLNFTGVPGTIVGTF